MAHPGGRPTKLTPELTDKAQTYIFVADQGEPFGVCAGWTLDGSVIPTVEGLASYLLISRDTLYEWAKNDPQFSDILNEVKNQQALMLINGGLSNKYNATIAKLILSGKHGYVEKSEQDITSAGEKISSTVAAPELISDFVDFMRTKRPDGHEGA